MTKINSIEDLANHLGKKVRVADILALGEYQRSTNGRFYEGVLESAATHGTFTLHQPTEFGKDGKPTQTYNGQVLIDADSFEARNVILMDYNLNNVLYYLALGAGVNPDTIPQEIRTQLEAKVESVPIESLMVLDVLGGAIKAGFDALHQRGLGSVETYPTNKQGALSILSRFKQNTNVQKAAACDYLSGLRLPKPLGGSYTEAISSFYAMQLNPRQRKNHEQKMQQLVTMQFEAVIP